VDLVKTRNDVRVKSVWDHDADRAQKRAQDLNAGVMDDVNKIWDDPEIQAVVIYSETNRHHDLVLAAAKAGKHMFVEKPLGITARESLAMAEAIERASAVIASSTPRAPAEYRRQLIAELVALPALVTETLGQMGSVEQIAKKYAQARDFLGDRASDPLRLVRRTGDVSIPQFAKRAHRGYRGEARAKPLHAAAFVIDGDE
jgi:hypothetical protein